MSLSPEESVAIREAMKKGPVALQEEQPDGTQKWVVARSTPGGGAIIVIDTTKKGALKAYGKDYRDYINPNNKRRGKR